MSGKGFFYTWTLEEWGTWHAKFDEFLQSSNEIAARHLINLHPDSLNMNIDLNGTILFYCYS